MIKACRFVPGHAVGYMWVDDAWEPLNDVPLPEIEERPLPDAEIEAMCSIERARSSAHEMVRILEAHDHWKKRAERAEALLHEKEGK